MKTLVMFEAFGKKLHSEPEIMDIHLSENNIFMPFRDGGFDPAFLTTNRPVNTLVRKARFAFVESRRVVGWEHPIRVYSLVEI